MEKLYLKTVKNASVGGISLWNNTDFVVSNIEGLRLGKKELALSTMPYIDGDIVQNIVGSPRDITVEIKPTENTGDFSQTYDLFSKHLGKTVYLLWVDRKTIEGTFSMLLEGVMTECEMPMFSEDVRLTFTIHCSNPYWQHGYKKTVSDTTEATILGSAPPSNVKITIPNGTIPAAGEMFIGQNSGVEGWILISPTSDITGTIIAQTNPISLKVNGTSHLEAISNGFRLSELGKIIQCMSIQHPAPATPNTFSIEYIPQWY